ncbi:MAG: hypothetical protein WD448_05545, partial [Woeseia sp.]
MGEFGRGQAIRRLEDQRFITGTGQYTDDISLEGQTYLYIFRSPYAHGTINRLEVVEAAASPGVVAVYTADDLKAAGVRDVPGASLPATASEGAKDAIQQPPLARDRVRYVGEPVAAVLAETLLQAKDAAELIELEIDELEAAVRPADALQNGAETIHERAPGNHYGTLGYGDREAADAAFS